MLENPKNMVLHDLVLANFIIILNFDFSHPEKERNINDLKIMKISSLLAKIAAESVQGASVDKNSL